MSGSGDLFKVTIAQPWNHAPCEQGRCRREATHWRTIYPVFSI